MFFNGKRRHEELLAKLDLLRNQIAASTRTILAQGGEMAKTLDDVLADVDALKAAVGNAATELATLKADLDAAVAANDPAKIQAASDGIEAQIAALNAAAAAANPNPAPTPAP